MASGEYDQIRSAIAARKQIVADYGGYHREICPHAIGLGPAGDEKVMGYQFAGQSSKGDMTTQPPDDKWRCLNVVGLSNIRVQEGEWHTGNNHSAANRCISTIDLEVDY